MLNLHGAMTAMVTPFRNGEVDDSRLREQIEFQIASGIDGLVPVGTTGESPTLDFPEHERVIQVTVTIANRRESSTSPLRKGVTIAVIAP